MPYPPAGALPLALVASPFISPAPNFSGPAISPIDANEPVGSQGATLSYTAATEAEHVKLSEAYKRHMGYTDEQLRCADDLSETPPKPKPHLCAQVG